MVIKSSFEYQGSSITVEYTDLDSFTSLPYESCQQVYAVCFFDNQLVLVLSNGKWSLVGGHIEPGESFDQTLAREVEEETNMQVLAAMPIGVQKVTDKKGNSKYQLRYVAKVRPISDFIRDPAGQVTEIKLIEPSSYKAYLNWGEIGDRIIQRALELKPHL